MALRNLVIVPLPGGGGNGGVDMTAGSALTVENCLVANLPGVGINVRTAASARITDTTIRDNGDIGLYLQSGARATVTRARISGNGSFGGVYLVGIIPDTMTTVDIANSTIDGNSADGAYAYSGVATSVLKVSVRDSQIVRNGSVGVGAESSAGATVTLSASNNIISNNGTGIAGRLPGSKVWASGDRHAVRL